MREIIKKIAKANNVSESHVEDEMKQAIAAAMARCAQTGKTNSYGKNCLRKVKHRQ